MRIVTIALTIPRMPAISSIPMVAPQRVNGLAFDVVAKVLEYISGTMCGIDARNSADCNDSCTFGSFQDNSFHKILLYTISQNWVL